jgi:hypothetical protein
LPVKKNRKGEYKLQSDGDFVYTCFTSDFFHPNADEWRIEAWQFMKERKELQFFLSPSARPLPCKSASRLG